MDSVGNVIEEKRLVGFFIIDIGAQFDLEKADYFKMHEYSLCSVNNGLKSDVGVGDLVLCRITYDSSKKSLYNLASKSIDHGSKKVVNVKAILRIWMDKVFGLGIMIWRELRM
ncbi:hypothetical protein POM88_034943 [Heracleum sosnowskyi]|uniref:Uncharacterized protein n=1 Tax=Heracleum sosnowskyi TaxID=360622 RepID=A0AAD8MCU3_9APIA|nr:hypothetical protein POM88_034943 [Heracleum sosnowskyi]